MSPSQGDWCTNGGSEGRSGYSLLYRIHFRPWEFDPTPAELIEVADRLGPGRALELGCGTGRQAVELGRRGWEVTAVDYVPAAIDLAGSRAEQARTTARFLVGDVTCLDERTLGGPFDLVYDIKCFHGLSPSRRAPYAAGIHTLCRPGTSFLLWALPRSRGRRLLGMPAGVDPAEVDHLFGDAFEMRRYQPPGRGLFNPAFYEMVHHGS